MYKNLGYIIYRTVIDYYAGPGDVDEDAYGKYKSISNGQVKCDFNDEYIYVIDMRKAMPRDVDKKSMIPLKHPVHCDEVE